MSITLSLELLCEKWLPKALISKCTFHLLLLFIYFRKDALPDKVLSHCLDIMVYVLVKLPKDMWHVGLLRSNAISGATDEPAKALIQYSPS